MAHLPELGPVNRSSGSAIRYLCFACFCLFSESVQVSCFFCGLVQFAAFREVFRVLVNLGPGQAGANSSYHVKVIGHIYVAVLRCSENWRFPCKFCDR